MLDPTRRDTDSDFTADDESPATHSYADLTQRSPRSGGPRTSQGKSRSSKNSVTHGCRSNILILHDEKQEDFDALYSRWEEAYQPDTDAALELVEQFVLSKWYLERNERRFAQVEYQLSFLEFTKWDDGQHKIYQLALRYKTAAERSASKAQRDLEDYLKSRRADEKYRQQLNAESRASYLEMQEGMHHREHSMEDSVKDAAGRGLDVSTQKTELAEVKKQNRATLARMRENMAALDGNKTRAQMLFQGQNSPKKLRQIHILDQWVEVTVKDGLTVTQLTPSNQKLIERGQTMYPPPELVYRRLNFPHGVPDEYDWTTDDPLMKKYGGLGIQRMTVDTWLDIIDSERLRADGHIGPCGDPLPRPKERGGCECPACAAIRERLEGRSSPKPEPEPVSEPEPVASQED